MQKYLQEHGIAFEEFVPMQSKTSFKIGGAAELMLFPNSVEQLQICVKLYIEHSEATEPRRRRPFILGNGSNLLVKDSGLDGVVIATEQLQKIEAPEDGLILCEAGVKLGELCIYAHKHSLSGLEFAYGIPGSLGGAVYMNAGAYGSEMKDILYSVQYIDPAGELRELPAEQLGLGYRRSVFMQNGGIVCAAMVKLQPGDPVKIKSQMDDVMRRRREKQPLEYPSAGSVFKRPEGHYAGALIEQCGLKGRSVGGAQVSEKHAGFIINTGGAKARDVRALIALVQAMVEQETGVFLEPEINFI